MDDRSRPGDPLHGRKVKSKTGFGKSSVKVDSSAVMMTPAAPALATSTCAYDGASGDVPRSILKAAFPSLMRPHTPGGHIDMDGHASAVLVSDQQVGPVQAAAAPPAPPDVMIM